MNPLLVNVSELLRRPGNEKTLALVLHPIDLDIDEPRINVEHELRAALHLQSLTDGVVVTGSLDVPWHDTCRRCLGDIDTTTVATIRELYQEHVTNDDAFPIVGDQVNLQSMLRQVALLELPIAALCDDNCAGLCPSCGVDRNLETCSCDTAVRDSRFDVLGELRDRLN
jgi:uncharacterized protein